MRLLISFLFCVSLHVFAFSQTSQKPGSIDPNVITLPMEYPGDFMEGFAAIKNGNAWAVIDASGKYLIPYGKYVDIIGFNRGFCFVGNSELKRGAIDRNGNLILPFGSYISGPDADGYCVYRNPVDSKLYYINSKGKKLPYIPIKTSDPSVIPTYPFQEDLAVFQKRKLVNSIPQDDYGFMNRAGKEVIPINFSKARPFSEGLAAVAVRDEFGKNKWGYIDKTGAFVIPAQFTIEPGDFHSGRAYVIPQDKSKFAYGYINKIGMLVSAVPQGKGEGCITDHYSNRTDSYYHLRDFQNGYAIIDFVDFQNGSLKVIDTLNQARQFPTEVKGGFERLEISDGCFNIGEAIFDVTKGLVIPKGIFSRIGPFDPISHLAAASIYKGNGKYLHGYINKDGVFVIINKEDNAKW